MTVTLDTTLGMLLDDPQAKAALDKYLPGIASNPLAAQFVVIFGVGLLNHGLLQPGGFPPFD